MASICPILNPHLVESLLDCHLKTFDVLKPIVVWIEQKLVELNGVFAKFSHVDPLVFAST